MLSRFSAVDGRQTSADAGFGVIVIRHRGTERTLRYMDALVQKPTRRTCEPRLRVCMRILWWRWLLPVMLYVTWVEMRRWRWLSRSGVVQALWLGFGFGLRPTGTTSCTGVLLWLGEWHRGPISMPLTFLLRSRTDDDIGPGDSVAVVVVGVVAEETGCGGAEMRRVGFRTGCALRAGSSSTISFSLRACLSNARESGIGRGTTSSRNLRDEL